MKHKWKKLRKATPSKEYSQKINKAKKSIIYHAKKRLKLVEKKENSERKRIHELKEEIKKNFFQLEFLMESDDYFNKLVRTWMTNMTLIATNKSQVSTIRKLRTTARNEEQAILRKKIIKYAEKNKVNTQKTEQWLFIKERL